MRQDTLDYILQKYNLSPLAHGPQVIPATRNDLAGLFAELGFLAGAEIGVEQGLFTEVLCQANPRAKIYAVDAWMTYRGYREHVSQDKLDGFYEAARKRLSKYNCKIIWDFSREAVKKFTDGELDFVYIDGNHEFEHVIFDIIHWSKKVRRGGIVAGHDYRKDKGTAPFHVVQAVQAYTDAYKIPYFVLRGDRSASWMWVK